MIAIMLQHNGEYMLVQVDDANLGGPFTQAHYEVRAVPAKLLGSFLSLAEAQRFFDEQVAASNQAPSTKHQAPSTKHQAPSKSNAESFAHYNTLFKKSFTIVIYPAFFLPQIGTTTVFLPQHAARCGA